MDERIGLAVERWLIKAENDLRTAETILAIDNPITDTACFHAHQCAEKSLKAFLTHYNVYVEKTHDLTRLVEICCKIDPEVQTMRGSAGTLAKFAVASRYPDDWREIPLEEAKQATGDARKVFEFVKGRVKFK